MKKEDSDESKKRYVKVPKTTFILQGIFILTIAWTTTVELPGTAFGLPMESFITTWLAFVVLGVSSAVWLRNELKKEDK